MSKTKNQVITRALIVKKEWLDLIFDGGKVWEMRSTKTKIKGRIALIESGTGLIMGSVTITGCGWYPVAIHTSLIKYHKVTDLDLLKKWKYPWFLKDAKRYPKPIPYNHPKGAVIWVKIDPENF